MLLKIKDYMEKNNIACYIIPTADYHNSEYIAPFFKEREVVSGFTGSAGTLVITQDKSYLWTDGRYFIQAAKELKHDICLMKQGLPETPLIVNVLERDLNEGDTVCFSYKLMPETTFSYLKTARKKFNYLDLDITELFWQDRPTLPSGELFLLPEESYGISYLDKLKQVREHLEKHNTSNYLISALEDIAWLLNVRGNDVASTPVFLSYFLITNEKTTLYVDLAKVGSELKTYFTANNVSLKPYDEVYSDLLALKDTTIYLDLNRTNSLLTSILRKNNVEIKSGLNITSTLKAIKNDVEIKATKNAHLKDGAALVNFYYDFLCLYNKKEYLTEYAISELILKKRSEQKDFLYPSFTTITAFRENGAIMHYSPKKDSSLLVYGGSLLLIDSGGQYLDGTTDITRTFAVGTIPTIMKEHYTTVLKSVIALSSAVFLDGTTGTNLDILARGPIWQKGIEYRCGTGHGVGHVLAVHEGPNSFRQSFLNIVPLKPGMITTNEPGIYLEGSYGIRLEQELLTVPAFKTEFGSFYRFETITKFPFDLNCIVKDMLTAAEINWLNTYHKDVYDSLAPLLEDKQREFLKTLTRSI